MLRNAVDLKNKTSQVLTITQMNFLNLLTMNNQELERYMDEESMENPLIEKESAQAFSFNAGNGFNVGSYSRNYRDDDNDPIMNIAQPEYFDTEKWFVQQMDSSKYSERCWKVILLCINNIDDSGFFSNEQKVYALNLGFSKDELEYALGELKKLEPAGCFAADIRESICIQLERANSGTDDIIRMVSEMYDFVAAKKVTQIARELNVSTSRVREMIEKVSSMVPRPLASVSERSEPLYVIPDVVCKQEDDEWIIDTRSPYYSSYSLDDYYCMMMHETHDGELKEYFQEKMSRAKLLLHNIEQRRRTIIELTSLIIEKQYNYIMGIEPKSAFSMKDAAEIMGVNPSTISRTVKNKWIQFPSGVFEMKTLFTSNVNQSMGLSSDQVKEMLYEIIENENPIYPYSDTDLLKLLNEKGITISRRTVAKYRSELGIGSCYDRMVKKEIS